jgi:hypothetical protein
MTAKIIGILLAALFGVAGANVAAQTRGLVPTLAPTIYSAPTPAPLAPPINPGPAVVPPAGLSPLLTEPGPVYATPEQAMPAYPSPQLPGPVGQQNMQSNRKICSTSNGCFSAAASARGANAAAKSSSSLTSRDRAETGSLRLHLCPQPIGDRGPQHTGGARRGHHAYVPERWPQYGRAA